LACGPSAEASPENSGGRYASGKKGRRELTRGTGLAEGEKKRGRSGWGNGEKLGQRAGPRGEKEVERGMGCQVKERLAQGKEGKESRPGCWVGLPSLLSFLFFFSFSFLPANHSNKSI
jgi:hypothetical protein